MARSRRREYNRNNEERRMISRIERAERFEEFEREILPELRKMITKGCSAPEIYEFAQSYAAARAVTVALTDEDTGKAMTAVKDILDRQQGKAKERQEVEHKFSKLKDEELDALLASKLQDAEDSEVSKLDS